MTTLKTWYISTYASRREWIKLKVCFFGGSIGKTCVLILSFKAIPENCISLESWKTQLSNDILNEGINVFCGPLRSKIEMTNVIANHFSRCGSRLVLCRDQVFRQLFSQPSVANVPGSYICRQQVPKSCRGRITTKIKGERGQKSPCPKKVRENLLEEKLKNYQQLFLFVCNL